MKSCHYIACAAIMLGSLLSPLPGWAWGPEGHAIVADIAQFYLTPTAKEKVDDILGSLKLGDFEVSSWPDIIRGDREYAKVYAGNGKWHYIDFNASQKYDEDFELKPPADGQDIVSQIIYWRDELAKPDLTPERRLDALRFLVHFVGDLHQPLHCAYRYGDMGGNMIPVNSFQGAYYSFGPDTPMDYAPSIHSVWDEAMVLELIAGRQPKTAARQWRKEITPEQIQWWLRNDVLAWATESYWQARKKVYRWPSGDSLPWKWTRPGIDFNSTNYIDARLPLVKSQLQRAGVRLAHLINSALDPDYKPPPPPPPAAPAAEK